MTYQQLAMSRVRAVERNVAVIVAATSCVSAIVLGDGSVEQQTGVFEAATPDAGLCLGGAGTLATRLGSGVEGGLGVLGVLALALSVMSARRCRPTVIRAYP